MPNLSVIMPAYNAARTIQQTVESVLKQTFCDFELIVVNDGSTDSTLEIVSAIEDERVRVLSYPNRGSYPSRNQGIAHAHGDLIAFMDADDLWHADKLMAQVKALQAHPNAALAYCWTDWIDAFGQPLNQGIYEDYEGDVLPHLLLGNFIANGSNPLVRKAALDDVGPFAEDIVSGADWDMWLRLAARYHFVCVPQPYVYHRRTNDSWSANLRRLEAGSLEVIERAYKRAPDSLQHLKKQTLGRFYTYLAGKALTILPGAEKYFSGRQRGFAAARFLALAIRYKPSLLRQKRLMWSLSRQILTMILHPPKK